MRKKYSISILSLVIVAIIWGSGFVASSIALDYNSTNIVMVLRFSIASAALFIIKGKTILSVDKDVIKNGALLGVFLYLAFFFQTKGLEYTTASNNAFITSTNILIVPLIAYLIDKKKIIRSEFIGLGVSMIGLLLLTYDGKFGALNIGDTITFVAAVFFALHIFFTGRFILGYNEEETVGIMFYQMLMASFCSVLMLVISKDVFVLEIKALMPVVYLGLISTLLAYFLQTNAQKAVSQVQTAMILSTEAIFGAVFSFIVLKERLSATAIMGAVIIFIGIIVVEYYGKDEDL